MAFVLAMVLLQGLSIVFRDPRASFSQGDISSGTEKNTATISGDSDQVNSEQGQRALSGVKIVIDPGHGYYLDTHTLGSTIRNRIDSKHPVSEKST